MTHHEEKPMRQQLIDEQALDLIGLREGIRKVAVASLLKIS